MQHMRLTNQFSASIHYLKDSPVPHKRVMVCVSNPGSGTGHVCLLFRNWRDIPLLAMKDYLRYLRAHEHIEFDEWDNYRKDES